MNETIKLAVEAYKKNEDSPQLGVKIVKALSYIYANVDRFDTMPSLKKLDNCLKVYNEQGNLNSLLTAYKTLIDLIVKKYHNNFITSDEVQRFEDIFYEGMFIDALNRYWIGALLEINSKADFINNPELYNPYISYTQAMNINDIKDLSNDDLLRYYEDLIQTYHLKLDDKNIKSKITRIIRGKKCK